MDHKLVAKHVLRSTEILLGLIHQENQFSSCCQPLSSIQEAVGSSINELKAILVQYKEERTAYSSTINHLLDCWLEETGYCRQDEQEECVADKLVLGFSITLFGCFHLIEIYDKSCPKKTQAPAEGASILSVKQETTIRLSLGRTFKLCFGPLMRSLFMDGSRLFPITTDSSSSIGDSNNRSNIPYNIQLCCFIYRIFLKFAINAPTESLLRIQANLYKDCFVILVACRVIFITFPEFRQSLTELHKELNSFSEIASNQQMILRDLLLLRNCMPVPKICALLNRFLMQTFKKDNGITILVNSILDSDPLSESTTTITNRIDSIASILVLLPVQDVQDYLRNLVFQSMSLLQIDPTPDTKHSTTILWRVASQVLWHVYSSHQSFVDEMIFNNINSTFTGLFDSSIPSIETAINILNRIINSTVIFPPECFYYSFRSLLFIRYAFERSPTSPMKTSLDNVILYILHNVPESVYLLDETINLPLQSWLNKYEIALDRDTLQSKITVRDRTLPPAEDNFEAIELFARFVADLTQKMSNNFVYDLFFLLLEKIINDKKNVLCLILLSYLGESLMENGNKMNEDDEKELLTNVRRIRFLSNTFERIVCCLCQNEPKSEPSTVIIEHHDDEGDEFGLFVETLKICISILVVIVEKLEQTPFRKDSPNSSISGQIDENILENIESIQRELKICQESLRKFLLHKDTANILQPLERLQAEDILERLGKFLLNAHDDVEPINMPTLNRALSNLTEPLIPVRAHGLIVIKQLVQSRDSSIEAKFELILNSIQELLIDSESYLYLAAINALGALAINYTDRVLPLLLDELIGANTQHDGIHILALPDRHKIGEVLMQLAKSIGDFAYHYSGQFIGKLLLGVKNPDPTIRICSLVCLGKYCRNFKLGLSSNIVELVFMGENLLLTDDSMEVRRAAADFFRQLLEGLDKDNVWLVQDHIKTIKDALLKAAATNLDNILQLHCSLAFDELSRIAQELLHCDNGQRHGFKEIK